MKRGGSEITLLLSNLDDAYQRAAWHGPNLRGSLRGVSAREAAWRPAPGRHNIWEIAVHAAYWKYAVWRRLTGQKRGSFPIRGSNWFKRPETLTEKAWKADLAMLERLHRQVRAAAAQLRASDLPRRSRGSRRTNATLVYGIAAHDVYHAGQIQLLKALRRKK
jgi:hypothetical protein